MTGVNYGAFAFDPWKKYEDNKEYLLRQAGMESQIKNADARTQTDQQRLGLDQERFGLSKQEHGLRIKQESRLAGAQDIDNKYKQTETARNQLEVVGNLAWSANDEQSYKSALGIMANTAQGMGNPQLAEQITSQAPASYEQGGKEFMDKLRDGLSEKGKKLGFKEFKVESADGKHQSIRWAKEGEDVNLAPGERLLETAEKDRDRRAYSQTNRIDKSNEQTLDQKIKTIQAEQKSLISLYSTDGIVDPDFAKTISAATQEAIKRTRSGNIVSIQDVITEMEGQQPTSPAPQSSNSSDYVKGLIAKARGEGKGSSGEAQASVAPAPTPAMPQQARPQAQPQPQAPVQPAPQPKPKVDNPRISNGYVWAYVNGKPQRLFAVEPPTVKYGNKTYKNPKYDEYVQRAKEVGLGI